jgi:hypothetical protein
MEPCKTYTYATHSIAHLILSFCLFCLCAMKQGYIQELQSSLLTSFTQTLSLTSLVYAALPQSQKDPTSAPFLSPFHTPLIASTKFTSI